VDAEATEIHIYTDSKENDTLIISDNGVGMDRSRFEKMLSLGYCEKGEDKVGKYGNGFKSGSMRLGKDAIVFTKNGLSQSVGFLSQTFLEAIHATEVLVPMCTWDLSDKIMGDVNQAEKGLTIMSTYSPFESEEAIRAEFSKIKGTGTLIYIYNLSNIDGGACEFQFLHDDIKLTERREADHQNPSISDAPYKYSLLAYCEVLYLIPRTQIFIQKTRVNTKLFTHTLCKTKTGQINLKGYPTVNVTFGFVTVPQMRAIDFGVYMYHRNRLIEPSVKVGMMVAGNSVGVGVFGCVEFPYLTPTHNKQGFMQNSLYTRVKRNLAASFNTYWKSCVPPGGITSFWKSMKIGVVDKRFQQCCVCRKWRPVPDDFKQSNKPWQCSFNTIRQQDDCEEKELRELIHTNRTITKQNAKRKRDEFEEDVQGKSYVGREVKVLWSKPAGNVWETGRIINYSAETDEVYFLFHTYNATSTKLSSQMN